MRILIVGFWFPPANVIGAVRLGKLARYLDRRGHEVRVLTADIAEDRSLPLEIPQERVVYTSYERRRDWLDFLARTFPPGNGGRQPSGSGEPPSAERAAAAAGPLRTFLRRQYYGLLHLPDMRVDWLKSAIPAGMRLIGEWRPDIIFSSAPPYTGFILASRLSRATGVPWVADFRDLWVDNPYYGAPWWRRPIDAVLEQTTLRNAAALVTVSPIWAEQLRRRHGKAAEVIYNGYAEEDFPPVAPNEDPGRVLTIRYLGSIYPTFRDPSALFAAIGLLPEQIRSQVLVEFYCDAGETVLAAAGAHRVLSSVAIKPRVPYRRALELQMEADVLLLLQSSEPRDEGNIPAKLFEYLYARRPILFLGYERGVAAQLVRDRAAGLVSNAPAQIRDRLQEWVAVRQKGRLTRLDPSVSRGLSRDEQFSNLERLFGKILRAGKDMRSIAVGLLFCVAGVQTAAAQDLAQQSAALKEIRETAADICYTVQQEGQQSESELSGKVQAQLNGVISKLVQLNIEGAGKLSNQQYQGVLREQLASTLKHSADCRKDVFDKLLALMFPKPPPPPPPRPLQVAGWIATFGAKEQGGGSFRQYPQRTCLISTPAAIDIRPFLPRDLSSRNVLVSMTAMTDHQVAEPGRWVYYLKINGAPLSYTQCMSFEVQSDGIPIGGGAMPVLQGASTSSDASPAAEQSQGIHRLTVKLACYFQGGQFPVLSVNLKPPSGVWRPPGGGDFTVAKPASPDKPPGALRDPACTD